MKDDFTSIKTVFDNAPIGMILTTVSGRIVNINNYMIKMLGYSSFDDVKKNVKNMAEGLYAIPELREKIIASAIKNEVNIIKDHKGSLRFISDVNKGTTVIIKAITIWKIKLRLCMSTMS